MNSVERVKLICKERKIPISKLEKTLGFGNGYIRQLKKGSFPDNRLAEIARFLEVSPEFLLTGEEQKNKPAPENGNELSEDYAGIVDTVASVRDSDGPVTTEEFIAMLRRNKIISEGHNFDEADYRFVESQINMLNSWFKKD